MASSILFMPWRALAMLFLVTATDTLSSPRMVILSARASLKRRKAATYSCRMLCRLPMQCMILAMSMSGSSRSSTLNTSRACWNSSKALSVRRLTSGGIFPSIGASISASASCACPMCIIDIAQSTLLPVCPSSAYISSDFSSASSASAWRPSRRKQHPIMSMVCATTGWRSPRICRWILSMASKHFIASVYLPSRIKNIPFSLSAAASSSVK
mmetsp:Transcript_36637/g.86148  ORF Transcript_36637/g.86148 Transcript_36637/m.86148 type:complete len:213 (-) Transcript_36637:308-946(-)